MPNTVIFNRTNRIGDDVELEVTEVAKRFWASDEVQAWLADPTGPLERLALSWVAENIGGWDDHSDWGHIFHAIHNARPWANDGE